jgi:hypothetical protein
MVLVLCSGYGNCALGTVCETNLVNAVLSSFVDQLILLSSFVDQLIHNVRSPIAGLTAYPLYICPPNLWG